MFRFGFAMVFLNLSALIDARLKCNSTTLTHVATRNFLCSGTYREEAQERVGPLTDRRKVFLLVGFRNISIAVVNVKNFWLVKTMIVLVKHRGGKT